MTKVAAVLLLTIVSIGASTVKAATVLEYTNFWAGILADLLPNPNPCDGSYGDGCVRSSAYWGSHYPGAPTPEKDLPWPEPATLVSDVLVANVLGSMCPDVFRAIAVPNLADFQAIQGGYQTGFHYLQKQFASTSTQYYYGVCNGIVDGECQLTFVGQELIFPVSVTEPPYVDVYTLQELVAGEGDKPCYVVAGQYFAALNNICGGACAEKPGANYSAISAMFDAAKFIFGPNCSGIGHYTADFTPEAAKALPVLRDFNMGQWVVEDNECRGEYGPIMCNDITPNSTQCAFTSTPPDCKGDPCDGGCTYDVSYWKTHRSSVSVPKKNKNMYPSWNTICPVEFLNASGLTCTAAGVCTPELEVSAYPYMPIFTYAEILDTPAKNGEACLTAAKQVVAAELNSNCNSACITANGETAISEAKAILQLECVDIAIDNKGKTSGGLDSSVPFNSSSYTNRNRLLGLAEYLRDYNEGRYIGPGACDSSIVDMLAASGTIETVTTDSGHTGERVYGWIDWFIVIWIIVFAFGKCMTFVWVSFLKDCLRDEFTENTFVKPVSEGWVAATAPMPRGNRRAHVGNISDY